MFRDIRLRVLIAIAFLASLAPAQNPNPRDQRAPDQTASGGKVVGTAVSSALSLGLPLGIPPAPGNERMLTVPPEDASVYLAWSGVAEPGTTGNRTEALLANPEVAVLLEHVRANYHRYVASAIEHDSAEAKLILGAGDQLLRALLTHETAIYAQVSVNAPSGGLVCDLGNDAAVFRNLFAALAKGAGDKVTTTTVEGLTAYTLTGAPVGPMQLAVGNRYLILGVGDEDIATIIGRLKAGAVASWLKDARQVAGTDERIANLAYVNVDKIAAALGNKIPVPSEFADLGSDAAKSMVCLTALDDQAVVVRTRFDTDEALTERLQEIGKVITTSDIDAIAADATVMAVLKVNADALTGSIFKILDAIEPEASSQIQREFQRELGIDLRDDIVASLGDTIQVYESPREGGRFFTGWAGVIDIKDADKIRNVIQRLEQTIADPEGPVRIRQREYGDATVSYLTFQRRSPGFVPAWCLHKNRLIVAPFPQAIYGLLSRKDSPPTPKLLKQITEQDASLFIKVREDRLAEYVYPWLQILSGFGTEFVADEFGPQIDFDPGVLPSLPAITDQLDTATVSISLQDGVSMIRHQTLPPAGLQILGAIAAIGELGRGGVKEPLPDEYAVEEAMIEAPAVAVDEARAELDAAGKLASQGRHAQAIRAYRTILNEHDDQYEAVIGLGKSLYEVGEYVECEKVFNRAVALEPQNDLGYLGLGKAVWVQNRNEESIPILKKSLELNPESSEAWLFLGWAFNSLRDYEPAVKHFTTALNKNPNDWRGYYLRGVAYARLGNSEPALKDLNEAVKGRPDHLLTRYYRCLSLARLDQIDAAIEDISFCVDRDPLDTDYLRKRADLLEDAGHNRKAIRDYNALIGLNADDEAAWKGRGGCWMNLDNYDEAIANYDRAIELAPDQWAHANRAICWKEKGDLRKTIEDYTAALKLNPEYDYALRWRASAYMNLNEHAKAKTDFLAAISAGRDEMSMFSSFSWLLAASPDDNVRDGKMALQYATRAAEMSDWKEAWVVDNVAAAHAELGDFAKAIEVTKQALAGSPTAEEREELQQHLELYQQNKPVRISQE